MDSHDFRGRRAGDDGAGRRSEPLPASRAAERGAVLIYVAIMTLALIGLVGLAVDSAYVYTAEQKLQFAADAASLAAVQVVKTEADPLLFGNPFTLTQQAAIDCALDNEAASSTVKLAPNPTNASDGDIVVGYWDHVAETFTPDLLTPNAVRVRARRTGSSVGGPVGLFFGSTFGTSQADVGAVATAVMAPAMGALVLVLDGDEKWAFEMNGTAELTVNGTIHCNSLDGAGIRFVGTPMITAYRTSVMGGCQHPAGIPNGALVEGADYVPDPYAHVLPDNPSWVAYRNSMAKPLGPTGIIDSSGVYDPGFYPDGMYLDASDSVTLNPGIYMFGSPGVELHGSSFVSGSNVTLLIDSNAIVNVSGNSAGWQLTPTTSGMFEGLAIFSSRQNNHGPKDTITDVKLGGGGLFDVEGTIYVPSGHTEMAGTPGKNVGGIITNTLDNNGTTGFHITGKGVKPGDGPDYPFLVE